MAGTAHSRLRIFLACALILLAACSGPADIAPQQTRTAPVLETAQAQVAVAVAPVVEVLSDTSAVVATPVVIQVRQSIQSVLPAPPVQAPRVSQAAADLIIRWEVTSPAHYTRKLQRPIWPGGASGITWGIGYDGGHQTATTIARDWQAHMAVDRLATSAGITGTAARDALPGFRGIATPFDYASAVFRNASLPVYHGMARRAFLPAGFDAAPADLQGVLVSLTYNRGGSMVGNRNREKRHIRDVCLPAGDVQCTAAQLRAMCRIWAGTPNGPGLCNRREDEARLSERAA